MSGSSSSNLLGFRVLAVINKANTETAQNALEIMYMITTWSKS